MAAQPTTPLGPELVQCSTEPLGPVKRALVVGVGTGLREEAGLFWNAFRFPSTKGDCQETVVFGCSALAVHRTGSVTWGSSAAATVDAIVAVSAARTYGKSDRLRISSSMDPKFARTR